MWSWLAGSLYKYGLARLERMLEVEASTGLRALMTGWSLDLQRTIRS
jgi:hypothetical protein